MVTYTKITPSIALSIINKEQKRDSKSNTAQATKTISDAFKDLNLCIIYLQNFLLLGAHRFIHLNTFILLQVFEKNSLEKFR